MGGSYTGRCACGQITLSIAADPVGTRQCWCRQCQQIAAGGPTHNAIFPAEAVSVEGELASAEWKAASRNTLTFHFCPACGTQIYGQSSARMHLKTVRFGAIDQPHGLKPQMAIWVSEAPDWAQIDPGMEQYPQQQPIPVPKA